MGQCEYGKGEKKVQYHDYDKKDSIAYECSRSALQDKNYCEFHDNEYTQSNPDAVMKLFYALVDEAVQKAKPLFCIGFYLPGKVVLVEKEFKDRVYFSNATFTKEADFSSAAFTERASFYRAAFTERASFSYVTFTERASFSSATFTKEADFSRSDFKDEVNFDKSIFPSPNATTKSPSNSSLKASSEDSEKILTVDNNGSYEDKDFQLPAKEDKTIPITFDYCTYRKRVQFIGHPKKDQLLELGLSISGTWY